LERKNIDFDSFEMVNDPNTRANHIDDGKITKTEDGSKVCENEIF